MTLFWKNIFIHSKNLYGQRFWPKKAINDVNGMWIAVGKVWIEEIQRSRGTRTGWENGPNAPLKMSCQN